MQLCLMTCCYYKRFRTARSGSVPFSSPIQILHSSDRPLVHAVSTLQCKAYGLFCNWTDHEGDGFALMPHWSSCCLPRYPQHCICYKPVQDIRWQSVRQVFCALALTLILIPGTFFNQTTFTTSQYSHTFNRRLTLKQCRGMLFCHFFDSCIVHRHCFAQLERVPSLPNMLSDYLWARRCVFQSVQPHRNHAALSLPCQKHTSLNVQNPQCHSPAIQSAAIRNTWNQSSKQCCFSYSIYWGLSLTFNNIAVPLHCPH